MCHKKVSDDIYIIHLHLVWLPPVHQDNPEIQSPVYNGINQKNTVDLVMNLYLKQETLFCINNIICYGWSPADETLTHTNKIISTEQQTPLGDVK